MMLGKHGGYLQGYNVQIVCARRQILLAIEAHDDPSDMTALVPMVERTQQNHQAAGHSGAIQLWLADSGYASTTAFETLADLPLLVSVTSEAHQAGIHYQAPTRSRWSARHGRPTGHTKWSGPLSPTQCLGRARIRSALPTVWPAPQLSRPPGRRHRTQAPRHRPQPQQAGQTHSQGSRLTFTKGELRDSLPARRPVHRNPPLRARDARRARRTGDLQPVTTWDESSPAARHTSDRLTTRSAPNRDELVANQLRA